jgi:tetratricopeptide (TPR) repeat protein
VRGRLLICLLALLTTISLAQDSSDKTAPDKNAQGASSDKAPSDKAASDKAASDKAAADKAAAGDDQGAGESSSRADRVDLNPPKDDEKNHPSSKAAVAGLDIPDGAESTDTSGIQEFHPWNPLKSSKDVQIGDFYSRRKNYKAALDRYKEALYYKEGDAVATFKIGECEEKLGNKAEAKKYFAQYLKILPDGPSAKDARASLERLEKAQ